MPDETLLDPDIPDGEETRYRGLISGSEAGEGRVRIEHVKKGSRAWYRQLLEMRVLGRAEYEGELLFRRLGGALIAERYRLETRDRGRQVALEEGRFRGVETVQWGGELEPFPEDMAPLLGCALALRGLDFRPGARRDLSVWLANTVHWEVHVRVEERERIELPTGAHEAWRVRAWPSLHRVAGALDQLVAALLPPFRLHFAAEPPHRFLRFSFPTGPFPWNPRGLIEAVELD